MLFFFKDPAPTEIYTLSLHAALPFFALRGARRELDERTAPLAGLTAAFVFAVQMMNFPVGAGTSGHLVGGALTAVQDRKSTRLNSSHANISYAVFCLKKKMSEETLHA